MSSVRRDKNDYWVNAETIMRLTGFNAEDMRRLRKNNQDVYMITSKGGYKYNVNAIPESLLINKPVKQ